MIHAITGLNGAGKTAYAVGLLRAYQARGFKVAANIRVGDIDPVSSFDELMQLRDCVLLVDEVTAVASSRQFASLTPEALLFFQTLRHSGIGLIWTAPTYDRADLALRSLTLRWTHLSPILTRRIKGSVWRSTVLALARTGRPTEGIDGPRMVAPFPSLYRPSKHYEHYDSFADVDLFSRSRFPSRCPGCGAGIGYARAGAVDYFPSSSPASARWLYCSSCGTQLGRTSPPHN